jgi:hypothetical protein
VSAPPPSWRRPHKQIKDRAGARTQSAAPIALDVSGSPPDAAGSASQSAAERCSAETIDIFDAF